MTEAVNGYFAAIDSGRYQEAYDMMSDANKAQLPYGQFRQEGEQFKAQAGPLQLRKLLKVTWTKDPASAPYPGVYAAVDETASYRNVDRQCGYVIIYQAPPGGALNVMRTESNFISNASAAKIAQTQSPAELNRLWAMLSANCPNFELAVAQRDPLEEGKSSIEYHSVADARAALRVKPGVVFTSENGWLIATDEKAYTIWSFAPQGYPAYPAVVKRWVIPKQIGSEIRMDALCEASKPACDDLVRTFAKMNNFPIKG